VSVSVHVLDNSRGCPAVGVAVRLARCASDGPLPLGDGVTDPDGRLAGLAPEPLRAGTHRLVFETGAYYASVGLCALHPRVVVEFEVAEGAEHYHVPLLVTPFAYTTYQGS
jgi:5-hydroxyisourate hydrolase